MTKARPRGRAFVIQVWLSRADTTSMSTIPISLPHSRSRPRVIAVALRHPATWLGLIMSVSVVARLAAAWNHTSPRMFPDEYLYPAIARSLANGDGLAVRGSPCAFPGAAGIPRDGAIWYFAGTATAFRLTQGRPHPRHVAGRAPDLLARETNRCSDVASVGLRGLHGCPARRCCTRRISRPTHSRTHSRTGRDRRRDGRPGPPQPTWPDSCSRPRRARDAGPACST